MIYRNHIGFKYFSPYVNTATSQALLQLLSVHQLQYIFQRKSTGSKAAEQHLQYTTANWVWLCHVPLCENPNLFSSTYEEFPHVDLYPVRKWIKQRGKQLPPHVSDENYCGNLPYLRMNSGDNPLS